jgi:Tfp pilus assembly protein PilX
MNKPKANRALLQFMLRAQQIAQQDRRSEQGYGMLIVSITVTILLGLLGVCLAISGLSRSATNAYIKGTSTFYAAESGLNQRAQLIYEKVKGYAVPTGTSPQSISQCLSAAATSPLQYTQSAGVNDFGCKSYTFASNAGTAADLVTSNGASTQYTQVQTPDSYVATTYVVDNPDKLGTYPQVAVIPTGEQFAGLSMLQYTHRVYSTAQIQTAGTLGDPEKIVLQLNFLTRFVPLFQFAAFYNQDLEITPGPNLNLNGRIFTNSNLYLTSNATLCIAGQVGASGNIFNRRKQAGNNGEQKSNGLVYIYPIPGNCIPGATQVANNQLLNTVTYEASPTLPTVGSPVPGNYDSTNKANMSARFGTNVQDNASRITVPDPGFLSQTDSTGALTDYYSKADLRIQMLSNPAVNAIPFNVASLATGMGNGSTCAGFNIAIDRAGANTLLCTQFAAGQLHSLREPVLVMTGQSTDDNTLCTTALTGVTPAAPAAIATFSLIQKQKIAKALQTAIVSQSQIVPYSQINNNSNPLSTFPTIQALFTSNLLASGIPNTVTGSTFAGNTFAEIAAIAQNCFLPAPIQTYNTFYNNREGKSITMLQTNIDSLTVWNRDGLYVNLQVDGSGNPSLSSSQYQVQSAGNNSGQGNNANQQVFQFAPIPTSVANCTATDNLCKSSFRHLGLASADTSEGGLVFHLTVDNNNAPGTNNPYPATQSPYGFAIAGGIQLPGRLTIATDQAAYLQGDYNFAAVTGNTGNGTNSVTGATTSIATLSNTTVLQGGYKFPAAILSDSLNVTSNNCLNSDRQLNCGVLGNSPSGNLTTINTAFLGGNDIIPFSNTSNYSGGLHNYPRFHESWSGALNYQGSFISLGAPLQVSGSLSAQVYSPPTRNWDYDADFNNVANLPPLTPNVVYLRQDVFKRAYN